MTSKIYVHLFLHSVVFLFFGTSTTIIAQAKSLKANAFQPKVWLTSYDGNVLLQLQQNSVQTQPNKEHTSTIVVDDDSIYQSIDGFGFTLTGGSAALINQLNKSAKNNLLQELFGKSSHSISSNVIRISIGASDLNDTTFSYNDMPKGERDTSLQHFSLAQDTTHLIPLLQQILTINPAIKIIATPWSPPTWMKTNNSFIGGSLQPAYYKVYASYFVAYIQQMQKLGIPIYAITPQNEPLHPKNNPSLLMLAEEQQLFIKNYLGPAFKAANISTKIIIYDHNCDNVNYPLSILNDSLAASFIDGSAFHLYAGDISALSVMHKAHPNKNVYFTEQYTASTGKFGDDLQWHIKNVLIGAMNNWSKTALEWNVANDEFFGPHTIGGCTTCKGAITINKAGQITRNVAYYIIAQASKFIPSESVRIYSSVNNSLNNVAFKTPDNKKVLIVQNESNHIENVKIVFQGKSFNTSLPAASVATIVW